MQGVVLIVWRVMVSSPAYGRNGRSVSLSGEREGVARCDNVTAHACAADYSDLSLSWAHTADGIISEGYSFLLWSVGNSRLVIL